MLDDLCFEIIDKCPNECLFCSSNASYNNRCMISLSMFKKVINHLCELGCVREVSLSGGEPFLHPNLYEMIMFLKTKNIRCVLFTSGVRENYILSDDERNFLEHKIEEKYHSYFRIPELPEYEKNYLTKCMTNEKSKIASYQRMQFNSISRMEMERLKKIGLDKIVFDFQASNGEDYLSVMGKSHFEYLSSSLIKASAVGLDTDVHFIPMKKNYLDFPDIIDLLNIAGVKKLSILNFVPQGRGWENRRKLMLSDEEMMEFKKIYERESSKFKGDIRVGIPLLGEDTHKCTAGFSKMVIKYDGTVLPCPAFKEFDLELLKREGIPILNIYRDLDKIKFYSGTRTKPLCKKLYNINRSIK